MGFHHIFNFNVKNLFDLEMSKKSQIAKMFVNSKCVAKNKIQKRKKNNANGTIFL